MPSIDLHNTFYPGQEIVDPELFAGRQVEIVKALKALMRPGASILVYGERGVGKTSFVEMIKLLAQGQVDLLYRHKLHKYFPPENLQFTVVSVECDEDVDSTRKVLQRLITNPDGFQKLIEPRIDTIETIVKDSLSVTFLKNVLAWGRSAEEKVIQKEFEEKDIYEVFSNLVQLVAQKILKPSEGLLIVVDEFDKVTDNRHMPSLIKTLSKNNVTFILSGVAHSYTDLLQGHQSVQRQLFHGRIGIESMEDAEIEEIFRLVEFRNKGIITFQSTFKEHVKEMAHGYPYFVQLFGQLALDNCAQSTDLEKHVSINSQHLKNGLRDFARYEPVMDAQYSNIVGNYPERELFLKALARQVPRRILQSNVFAYCQKKGIIKPKKMLSTLLGFKQPDFLTRVSKDYVSFTDPLFKVFCSVRIPLLLVEKDEEFYLPYP